MKGKEFGLPILNDAYRARKRDIRIRAIIAIGFSLTLTLIWASAVTLAGLWDRVINHWPASLTMVFGSFVAGSTPQGGGAVAFPVFTKVLDVPTEVARSFSLCIQTAGMGAATVAILINRRAVEWKTVIIATGAGAIGFLAVTFLLCRPALPFAPSLLPSAYVKVTFTIVLTAMAFVVFLGSRVDFREIHRTLPRLNFRMISAIVIVGVLGGGTSALVGSGIDVFVYLALVIFFAIDPKVGVPTSVMVMALISILGFFVHGILFGQLAVVLEGETVATVGGRVVGVDDGGRLQWGEGAPATASRYDLFGLWLAAVPVVVWGAPLGSLVASLMTARHLVLFATALAATEIVSTALFLEELHESPWLVTYAILGTAICLTILFLLARHCRTIFRLPPTDIDSCLHFDRIDVRGEPTRTGRREK